MAQSPGTTSANLIGQAGGSFESVTGLTTESDSGSTTANSYSVQINSQVFTTNTLYTGNNPTSGWEQFVYRNTGKAGTVCAGTAVLPACVFIVFVLPGYPGTYGSCPATGPPGGSSWFAFGPPGPPSCYAYSAVVQAPAVPATSLSTLQVVGLANYNGPGGVNGLGNDQALACIFVNNNTPRTCFSVTVTDSVLNLSQNWAFAEFNVFGFGGGSQAIFNSGTSITLQLLLTNELGVFQAPTCVNTGFTGETNNLNLVGPCKVEFSQGIATDIAFRESTFDFSIIAGPSDFSVLQGGTAYYTVNMIPRSGPVDLVTPTTDYAFGYAFIPPTPTQYCNPSGCLMGEAWTLSVSAPYLGDAVITVQGADGPLTHAVQVSLHIYDFGITTTPSDVTVLRGGSPTYTVTLTLVPSSSTTDIPAIQLGTSGVPSDAVQTFGTNSLTPTKTGESTLLEITTAQGPRGSLGDFPFQVTTSSPHAAGANLHIYDFTVLAPPSLQVLTTGSNMYGIAVVLTPGSSTIGLPTIALTLTGLPSGATYSFSPSGVTPTFLNPRFPSSTLTITTSNTPGGTYGLTITGSDPRRMPFLGTRTFSTVLTVLTPAQALSPSGPVLNQVISLESAGVLNLGQANSLKFKLEAASRSLSMSPPNTHEACGQLSSFVNEVNSLVADGVLTPAQASQLLGGPLGIYAIMAAIPC